MPSAKETKNKRKRSYDNAPVQQKNIATKRRRLTSVPAVKIDQSKPEVSRKNLPNSNMDMSPYAFYSPEREDLSSFLTTERLRRSAKRRLSYHVKSSKSAASVSKRMTFKGETNQSASKKCRKRPIDEVLDDSMEESVVIKGKPTNKKQRKVLSDSLLEDFYLTDEELDSDCDRSADDIFSNLNDEFLPFRKETESGMNVNCTLKSCKKHKNSVQALECASRRTCDECRYIESPSMCPNELEQLERAFEENRCLFPKYSTEYYTILKEVDYGNGRSPSVYLYGKPLLTLCNKQQRTLHVDRTFTLGNCYVTMFVFRNTNLVDSRSKKKYSPLMTGPVMLHFDTKLETYTRFFEHVREKAGIQSYFEPETNRRLPKRDQIIGSALRHVFGAGVSICDIFHQPGHVRTALRENVKCFDSLIKVVEQLTFIMNCERSESKRCLEKRSIWKMVPRAKAFMAGYTDTAFPMKYLDELSLSLQ